MIFINNDEIQPLYSSNTMNLVDPTGGKLVMTVAGNQETATRDVDLNIRVLIDSGSMEPDIQIANETINRDVEAMRATLTDIYCTLIYVSEYKGEERAIDRLILNHGNYFFFVRYNPDIKMYEFISVNTSGIKMPRTIYDLIHGDFDMHMIKVGAREYKRFLDEYFQSFIYPLSVYNVATNMILGRK